MHPLVPIIQATCSKYFDSFTIEYRLSDENIKEPFISLQGTKPSKQGETIYCLTLTIKELEHEIVNGDGIEPFLLEKLAGLFNAKDLRDYYKITE